MAKNAIPVLYYHSVADHSLKRPWSFLSCPVDVFKAQMNWLKKNGYCTCSWKELHEHISGVKKLPEKTVHLQFDDGFLDNWSVVFPVMKDLGLRYTVLLTPDFIERSAVTRPFVDKTGDDNLKDWWGYLNSAEIMKMAGSGIVEFQSHGHTHTWYECSDDIIDFFDGTQLYPHLFWNNFENEKPFWLTVDWTEKVSKGYPVFKFEKSLNNMRRFFPERTFIDECLRLFEKTDEKEIISEVRKLEGFYRSDGRLGRFETEEELTARIRYELAGSKKELEMITGKDIDFIVWPGGGQNEKVIEAAFEAGYKMVSKGQELNTFNSGAKQISRIAGFIQFPVILKQLNMGFIRFQVFRAQGNQLAGWLVNLLKKLRRAFR